MIKMPQYFDNTDSWVSFLLILIDVAFFKLTRIAFAFNSNPLSYQSLKKVCILSRLHFVWESIPYLRPKALRLLVPKFVLLGL